MIKTTYFTLLLDYETFIHKFTHILWDFKVSIDVQHVYYLLLFQIKEPTIIIPDPTYLPFIALTVFDLKPTLCLINYMVNKTSKIHILWLLILKCGILMLNINAISLLTSPGLLSWISIEGSWNDLKISILQGNFYFSFNQLKTLILVILLIEPLLT